MRPFQKKLWKRSACRLCKHGISPAAYVQSTHVIEDVNSIIEYKPLSFFKELGSVRTQGKDKRTMKLPVIVNVQKLDEGSELLLYRATKDMDKGANKRVSLDCGLQSPSKARRTG